MVEILANDEKVPIEVIEAAMSTLLEGCEETPPRREKITVRRMTVIRFSSVHSAGVQLLPDTVDLLQGCIFLAIPCVQAVVSRFSAGRARE